MHDNQITLSMALGVCLMSFRFSAFLSMVVTPVIYAESGFTAVLWTTAGIVLVSTAACAILVPMNTRHQQYLAVLFLLQLSSPPCLFFTDCVISIVLLQHSSEDRFNWRYIFSLSPVYWLIVITASALYGSVQPFISFSTKFVEAKWGFTEVEAGWVSSG